MENKNNSKTKRFLHQATAPDVKKSAENNIQINSEVTESLSICYLKLFLLIHVFLIVI